MGNLSLLTDQGKKALEDSEKIYAFDRLAGEFASLFPGIERCTYGELTGRIGDEPAETVSVVVSGDVGFFSAAKSLMQAFGEKAEVCPVCGINSLQYLAAKCGVSYENTHVVSLHGREGGLLGAVSYHEQVFVLTGTGHLAGDILRELSENGLGHLLVTAGEALSMQEERIVTGSVAELAALPFSPLTVLLITNSQYRDHSQVLFDKDFMRGKAPMTKQEIRWATLGYLNIRPTDTVYDIGAGTGSVTIEMARRAYAGAVYGIERQEEAFSLLLQNRERLGAYNVIPVFGDAWEQIQSLPPPDKVFIGGSGKELPQLLPFLLERNPDVTIVINAITLETLGEAVGLFQKYGLSYGVSCLNVANSKTVGEYNLMMANNPVYIMWGKKK